MKKIMIFAAVLALAACGKNPGKPAAAKRGQPAPAVVVEKMLQGDLKSLKGWDELKGKAVVLEFWGTTCHPCVANIPHMNELVEKFKDKPVVFIQVSKESEAAVREFLAKHEMKANVAAGAGDAFKSYRIFGIPHAVLIDRNGILRGGMHPAGMDAKTIDDLLAGKDVGSAPAEEEAPGDEAPKGRLAYFYAGPAGEKPNMRYGGGSFETDGLTLDYTIETAMLGLHGVEFVGVPEELKNRRIKVSASVALSADEDSDLKLRELVASGLSGALPIEISFVRKEKKVWLLKRAGALKPGLEKVAGMGGSRNTGNTRDGAYVDAKGAGLDDLAKEIEGWLGEPVLDETGLKGNYNYSVKVAKVSPKAVSDELAAKLGLKLEEARREVEVAVVRGAQPAHAKVNADNYKVGT